MLFVLQIITTEERVSLGVLISRVSCGDKFALSAIYDKVGGRLLSVAMGIMRDRSLAEDVLSESFIKIVRFADKFKPGTNSYAWLCSIVRNTALNMLKSRNLHQGADIDSFFSLTDGKDFTVNTETALTVNNALKQLKPLQRTVIWLKYFNDMTVREISQELNIAKSTVQDNIKNAEKTLKALLKDIKNF